MDESQWTLVQVVRRCGHRERLVVQKPTEYVVTVASDEVCYRCQAHLARPTKLFAHAQWWT